MDSERFSLGASPSSATLAAVAVILRSRVGVEPEQSEFKEVFTGQSDISGCRSDFEVTRVTSEKLLLGRWL